MTLPVALKIRERRSECTELFLVIYFFARNLPLPSAVITVLPLEFKSRSHPSVQFEDCEHALRYCVPLVASLTNTFDILVTSRHPSGDPNEDCCTRSHKTYQHHHKYSCRQYHHMISRSRHHFKRTPLLHRVQASLSSPPTSRSQASVPASPPCCSQKDS